MVAFVKKGMEVSSAGEAGPGLQIGTFQAGTMIVNSSGQILPKTVHDHEATPTKRGRWDVGGKT
jgi:hypothetical protein